MEAKKLFKKTIKSAFRRMGFRISKISYSDNSVDPFDELVNLAKTISTPIIFDGGAYIGEVSKEFRKRFPSSTVYAFEPFEDSYFKLVENTKEDSQIKSLNLGFSDKGGKIKFHSNKSAATNSLLPTDENGVEVWGDDSSLTKQVVEAKFVTIEEFLLEEGIPHIDILKLDIQGAECPVMKAAENLCNSGRIKIVYSEIITQPSYESQPSFHEFLAVFNRLGFGLHNIYNLSVTPKGVLRAADAIFVHNSHG